jgi:hypothetical protein
VVQIGADWQRSAGQSGDGSFNRGSGLALNMSEHCVQLGWSSAYSNSSGPSGQPAHSPSFKARQNSLVVPLLLIGQLIVIRWRLGG